MHRRLPVPLALISLLAACQAGNNLGQSIPGTLSRTTTVITANAQGGAGAVAQPNGIPALVVPVGAGVGTNSGAATPIPRAPATADNTTSAAVSPTPSAFSSTGTGSSGGSGGGGSSGGGSGVGGSTVTPSASPTPSSAPSALGFQNLHGQTFTLAGNGNALHGGTGSNSYPGNYDGLGPDIALNAPSGVLVDPANGLVYFSDSGVGLVRTVSAAAIVKTRAGGRSYVATIPIPTPSTGPAFQCAATPQANLDGTWLGIPSDDTSSCNNVNPNGSGTDSRLGGVFGMARDSHGDLYVADIAYGLRKMTVSNGSWQVSKYATGLTRPRGVACDNSTYPPTIYVTDQDQNVVYKLPSNWTAGSAVGASNAVAGNFLPGYTDANGSSASFNEPQGIAIAPNGTLFVADSGNNVIRRIDVNNDVTTLCGSGVRGWADGTGANARFWYPAGLCLDSTGNLFVADTLNSVIRMVSPLGTVSTVAGQAGKAGFADGVNASAQFSGPTDVTVDSFGNLYVADTVNNRIRQVIR